MRTWHAGMQGLARTCRVAAALMLSLYWVHAALCGPIHDAARKGDLAKVTVLLKQNPDLVAIRDKLGNTPLHLAALHNQLTIANLLIANGADVNAENTLLASWYFGDKWSGETPLTLALLSFHHKEMMELLLTHGANVNLTMRYGATPLHRPVESDLPHDVELLLANGADPNVWVWANTPLRKAYWADRLHDRLHVMKMLLDYGADPNAKDLVGYTLMHYAESDDDQKVIALLRAYGGHS